MTEPAPWELIRQPGMTSHGPTFLIRGPYWVGGGRELLAPDAELIVRAVNAHDALVGACEAALALLPRKSNTAMRIRAALRLARGEAVPS